MDILPIAVVAVPGANPLPQREAAVVWQTTMGQDVTFGDYVAIRIRGADGGEATGRIVAADDGAPECVLGDVEDDPSMPHPRMRVDEVNLVALLRRAGGGEPVTRRASDDSWVTPIHVGGA